MLIFNILDLFHNFTTQIYRGWRGLCVDKLQICVPFLLILNIQ